MNREIKFRAWVSEEGVMVDNDYLKDNSYEDILEFFGKEGLLMQFTGLHDKNGKELYEGDIVSFSIFDHNGSDTQYKGVVRWKNAMFEIWHDTKSEYYGSDGGFVLAWAHSQDDEFEVIGNIYENPELLVGESHA